MIKNNSRKVDEKKMRSKVKLTNNHFLAFVIEK